MDADVLARVLRDLPPIDDPNVLVGNNTADDAGVYRLTRDVALVQTVDFFTPIVDDPRTFGAIAAANALSDVYAMGARPLTAVAIAAFPESGVDVSVLAEILTGGAEKAREAGISVIGGHTVKDDEPKYGLAVTGVVHPFRIIRNSTARAGDALVLTKRIGTGIFTTARRSDLIDAAALDPAIASMLTLNREASEVMLGFDVSAATDVTGFGLIGHLMEMTDAAKVGAEIDARSVPLFDGVLDLIRKGAVPGGTRANLTSALEHGVTFEDAIDEPTCIALCDAQTSGGLLVALPQDKVEVFLERLRAAGVHDARRVGRITAEHGIRVRV